MSTSIKGEVKPEDKLPNWAYFVTCFGYLLVVALAAIFIDDLTLIFGIIAGLAECTTVFILPSVLYLVACHNERKAWREYETAKQSGSDSVPKKPRSKKGGSNFAIFGVYLYLAAGTIYFFVSNYFNFAKILR